jgi:glycosyltransferase involved in cell wall biosynthesis
MAIAMTLNKKILIAIPCLLRGGTEQQTLLLVNALIESGYAIEVCCYFEWDDMVVAEFRAKGAKVQLLRWNRAIGTFTFIRDLARIFRNISPDVVHVQYMAPGLLPIMAARLAHIKFVVATVHQPGTPHGLKNRLLLRFGARLVHHFTCVSEAAEKSWFGHSYLLDPKQPVKIYGRRHLTIPNAVDIESIDKALKAKSPLVIQLAAKLKGKMIVGTVARLSIEKGIDILIEAFAEVHKAIPQSHLLIVGDGNQFPYLKQLVSNLDVSNAITWTGKMSWEEAMGFIGLMDVVVVPSRFEGFGLTAVEAMTCGKPVVASSVDGLAEIISDGENGVLVPSEDVTAFASALSELLNDEERRQTIGMAARRHVIDNYTYHIFRERVKTLYETVLGG